MKNITKIAGLLVIGSTALLSYTEKISVDEGWNLRGTTKEIKDLDTFLDGSIVRKILLFRDGKYVTGAQSIGTIKPNEGFWIQAKKDGTLEAEIGDSEGDVSSQPPQPTGSSTPISRGIISDIKDIGEEISDAIGIDDGANGICEKIDIFGVLKCKNDNDDVSTADVVMQLKKGWNLKGTSVRFKIKEIFDESCVYSNDGIKVFRDKKYLDYDRDSSQQIRSDEGFWVRASSDCTLKHADGGDTPPAP